MSQFSTIGLTGRGNNHAITDALTSLVDFLLAHASKPKVILDEDIAGLLPPEAFRTGSLLTGSRAELCKRSELVIVVGGDGSMLGTAADLAEHGLPVVGINRGKLGFLTDILPEEIEAKLTRVLAGEYKSEPRFLLDAAIEKAHSGQREWLGCALNDVVLHPGVAAQMIDFTLFIDGEFVYRQSSDGLIVATPTGSTAYSMSAGGPIMHPKLDALVLVPMYPHSLSSRPVVIDGNSEISILVGERHNIMPQLSCDGAVKYTTSPGDRIIIKKQARHLNILHPKDYNYYETCRSKLGWSQRPGKS